MISTTKKTFVALILCTVLLICMAVPVFAATNSFVPYRAASNSNNYLNIVGNIGDYMQGRKLNLWYTTSPGTDQTFTRLYEWYGGKNVTYFTKEQNGITYAINRASYASAVGGKQAIMWTLRNGGETDSAFNRPQNDPSKVFILAFNNNEGMRYSSDQSNATVYFASGSNEWLASGTPWDQP